MKFQEIFTKKYVFTKNFWQHWHRLIGNLRRNDALRRENEELRLEAAQVRVARRRT